MHYNLPEYLEKITACQLKDVPKEQLKYFKEQLEMEISSNYNRDITGIMVRIIYSKIVKLLEEEDD